MPRRLPHNGAEPSSGAKITAIDLTDHPGRIAEANLAFLDR
jgi:hypothetical protein